MDCCQLFLIQEQVSLRSLIHAPIDGIEAVNDRIDYLGVLLQKTRPVKDFDERFEKLKDKINQKLPKFSRIVIKYGEWAKKHPKLQFFVLVVLGMMIAGGGELVGGYEFALHSEIAATLINRAVIELLKGKKMSTAIGKSVKLGALIGADIGYNPMMHPATNAILAPLK